MHTSDREAELIYFSLFHKKIPVTIQNRFNDISKMMNDHYPPDEVRGYYSLINKVRDLEALELAARYLKKMPILTEKFKIMVYLAETVPDNYDVFINERPQGVSVFLCLACCVLRTIIKMPKGLVALLAGRV